MTIEALTNFLDRIHFWDLRIWDFGFRSLGREYGWLFLFKIIFKYPRKSWRGLQAYRQFCQYISTISTNQIYTNCAESTLINAVQPDRSALLVAMGYCQRPLRTESQALACPSPRFSHQCFFIENFHRSTQHPPACSICEIKPIAEAAIHAGATFYIMTSARDIARDIFIPTLASQKFRYAILFLCPYSVLPIALPLFICGIQFLIIPYAMGDCRNYQDFLRADVGIKPKRTFPARHNFQTALNILNAIRSCPK